MIHIKHRIIATCNCVFNQNVVVKGWARAEGPFDLTRILFQEHIGIVQLPCPELLYAGINREPKDFSAYNTKEYQLFCAKLSKQALIPIQKQLEGNMCFLGLIAIQESPSCSVSSPKGVFMRSFLSLCEQNNIHCTVFEIPPDYPQKNKQAIEGNLKRFLSDNKNY